MSTSGVPIADLAQAIKRRNPALANVPDDVLVRKVLERRPDLMGILQRSEPRPPMKSLYEQIGSRIKGNLNLPQQAQGAADAIHAGLKNIREHGPSQMPQFLEALKQYQKPENVIGDLFTAGILGAGESFPTETPKPVPRTPALMESAGLAAHGTHYVRIRPNRPV